MIDCLSNLLRLDFGEIRYKLEIKLETNNQRESL